MVRPIQRIAGLLLISGASASLGAAPALASPITYSLLTTIPVSASPDNSVGGRFQTYDISTFDPSTQLDYVADRSNAAVDIFSAATNTQVGRIGGSGQIFNGQAASNDVSGPDGLALVVSGANAQPTLYAGNGDSTLKAFNLTSANPASSYATITTGNAATDRRVDEMSFDPKDNLVLAANNAADTPFVSLISTRTNTVVAKIPFDGTNNTPNAIAGGIEGSAYNPNNGMFYISVPQIGTSGPGGVAEINPATGTVVATYDLSRFGFSACSPSGIVQGVGNQLLLGCGAGQTIIFDPTANGGKGAVVASFTQVFGSDEVAYDPITHEFFLAARDYPGGAVLGIIDGATDSFVENIPTTPGDHSVAVDPLSGEVFVPFGGVAGNTVCPSGCVAVYAPNGGAGSVPEPASLALLAGSVALLAGWTRARQRAA